MTLMGCGSSSSASGGGGEPAGPEAPGVPVNFGVVDQGPTSIDVVWSVPASGGAVDEYLVQVQLYGGDWSSPVVVSPEVAAENVVTLGSLTGNTRYALRIKASNAGGDSDWVTIASAWTEPVAPPAPSLDSFTSSSITLGPSTPPAGEIWHLWFSTSAEFGSAQFLQEATGGYMTASGLTAGTTYYFWLQATGTVSGLLSLPSEYLTQYTESE